jgi:predicted DNA-binding transcriptional regulator YafY
MQKDIFERLARIDHLIRIKGTGTPVQLASKIGVSERSVYDYLNLMKEFGAPIKFDTYRETYYYEEDGYFLVTFLPRGKISRIDRHGSQISACLMMCLQSFLIY